MECPAVNNIEKIALNCDPSAEKYKRLSTTILLSLVLAALVLKFLLLFEIPINQDEFHYLSGVYEYINGTLTYPFQNFHIHLFSWLGVFGPNEVNQVIGARMVMYLLFLGACIYLFLIGKYYLDTLGGLFSVLCYLSFAYIVANGANFRPDSISTFLFLFALYYFITKKETIIFNVLAGLAMGLAVMFTIKSAIHVTVFVVLALIELFIYRDFHKRILPISGFLLAFFLGSIIFYRFHVASLPFMRLAHQSGHVTRTLGNAYSTFVSFDQFFPKFEIFKLTLRVDFTIWLFFTAGVIFNAIEAAKTTNHRKNVHLFVLLIPMFSILFYRNAFPYFYIFITPTATLFCGYMLYKLTSVVKTNRHRFSFILVIFMGIAVFTNLIIYYPIFSKKRAAVLVQCQILEVIHKMFPDPVPYIDGCSMVSSFHKVGFFMSSAGMEGYLKGRQPIIEKLLTKEKPRFLLANVPQLNLDSDDPPKSDTNLAFMRDDWTAFKSHYIHHWGPVWVIGRHFEFETGYENHEFRITVPGAYTIESDEDVLIDEKLINAGGTVELETGNHSIRNRGTPGLIKIRCGDHLYRPQENLLSENLFVGAFL